MAKRRSVLRREYLLDDHVANQQMELLDKQATLELAKSVGVPFPQHWNVEKPEDVQAIEGDIDFPVIIKVGRLLRVSVPAMEKKLVEAGDE